MTFKKFIKYAYLKFIDIFHFPLVKKGSEDPYHCVFKNFLSLTEQQPSSIVLEIGSRNVTGIQRNNLFSHCEKYVGFDVLEGDGVDMVGDAHNLSSYFQLDYFDFVYSISVFEHLLSPWKVVLEINKVLKPGGHIFLSTHPAWPAHELPWDFWRFPANGFHSLFNKYTGFELIQVTEGLPGKLYSLVDDASTRNNCLYSINQGVALIAKKTGPYRSDLLKWDIDMSEIINTMYPEKK